MQTLAHERLTADDSFSLSHSDYLICLNVFYRFNGAAGPADLETVRALRVSQPEVDAKVVLPQIARACLDISAKDLVSDEESQSRADAVAIAFRTDGSHENGVVPIPAFVLEHI